MGLWKTVTTLDPCGPFNNVENGVECQQWKVAEEDLSVEEAIREAMEMSNGRREYAARPSILRDLPATEPHLPLRKAEPKRLHAPRPLWTSSSRSQQQVRGFNPSPVRAEPRIDNATASNEHAFAGREGRRRRVFRPALGLGGDGQEGRQEVERPGSSRVESRPPESPLPSPLGRRLGNGTGKGLRSSKSLGEGLKGLRHRFSQPSTTRDEPHRYVPSPPYASNPPSHRPSMATDHDHVRESFKSALTSSSSLMNASSVNTEQSSMTGNSSHDDFVTVYPDWPSTAEQNGEEECDVSVDDVLGMYEDGFSSAKQSMDTAVKQSLEMQGKWSMQQAGRPASQPNEQSLEMVRRPGMAHRRSQSASLLDRFQKFGSDSLAPPGRSSVERKRRSAANQPDSIVENDGNDNIRVNERPMTQFPGLDPTPPAPIPPSQPAALPPRDRYGFKTASNYYTPAAYAAWNQTYTPHLERRRRKWHALMKSYGLEISPTPYRFPPKSDKIKRYVRKGIPEELRGPAWFWYGGGPQWLREHPGLYKRLVEKVGEGLGESDREHIERDLNRTFPDNVRFKPDPTTTLDAQQQAGAGSGEQGKKEGGSKKKKKKPPSDPETPILQSLRRVLQAFAIHNPETGYCQSLNFIAGLLLLFLDADEEKAFILLNIVTTTHLPGTHGVALEGANIDIAVLMSLIRESLPAVWGKLDDKGGGGAGAGGGEGRLPTVSLATTAWFMSLFVGTLPIESVLRVWDCLFFEGSKVLFRVALAIFKTAQPEILRLQDPMEVFQAVQTVPRGLLGVNELLEVGFKRGKGGFGNVSQEVVEKRRAERRGEVRAGLLGVGRAETDREGGWLRRFRRRGE